MLADLPVDNISGCCVTSAATDCMQTIPDKLGTRANTRPSIPRGGPLTTSYGFTESRRPSHDAVVTTSLVFFVVVSAHYKYYHSPSVVSCVPIVIGMSLHTLVKRFRQPRSTRDHPRKAKNCLSKLD